MHVLGVEILVPSSRDLFGNETFANERVTMRSLGQVFILCDWCPHRTGNVGAEAGAPTGSATRRLQSRCRKSRAPQKLGETPRNRSSREPSEGTWPDDTSILDF